MAIQLCNGTINGVLSFFPFSTNAWLKRTGALIDFDGNLSLLQFADFELDPSRRVYAAVGATRTPTATPTGKSAGVVWEPCEGRNRHVTRDAPLARRASRHATTHGPSASLAASAADRAGERRFEENPPSRPVKRIEIEHGPAQSSGASAQEGDREEHLKSQLLREPRVRRQRRGGES